MVKIRINGVLVEIKEKSIGIPFKQYKWFWIPFKLMETNNHGRVTANFYEYNSDINNGMGYSHRRCIWIEFGVDERWLDFEVEPGLTNKQALSQVKHIELIDNL